MFLSSEQFLSSVRVRVRVRAVPDRSGVVQGTGLQSRQPGHRQSHPPQGRLRSHLPV